MIAIRSSQIYLIASLGCICFDPTMSDDVMGGVSTGSFRVTNGAAAFSWTLSQENNGSNKQVGTLQLEVAWIKAVPAAGK